MGEALEYRPVDPGRRVPRWIIYAVTAGVVVAALSMIWARFGPLTREWIEAIELNRELRTHLPSSTQPAMYGLAGEDPRQIYRRVDANRKSPPNFADLPAALLKLWPPGTYDTGEKMVGFCHERVSAAGHKRIVLVRLYPAGRHWGEMIDWVAVVEVLDAGSIFHPFLQKSTPVLTKLGEVAPGPGFSIFEGSPDPKDGEKFYLPYEVGNEPGRLIATLKDDDSIEFEVVPGSFKAGRAPGPWRQE